MSAARPMSAVPPRSPASPNSASTTATSSTPTVTSNSSSPNYSPSNDITWISIPVHPRGSRCCGHWRDSDRVDRSIPRPPHRRNPLRRQAGIDDPVPIDAIGQGRQHNPRVLMVGVEDVVDELDGAVRQLILGVQPVAEGVTLGVGPIRRVPHPRRTTSAPRRSPGPRPRRTGTCDAEMP